MSDNLKKVLEESSISQVIITVIVMIGAVWVQLTQGKLPEWMLFVVSAVIGFYFGAKSNSLTNKIADTVKTVAEMRPPSGPVAGVITTTVVTDVAPVAPITHVETTRAVLPAAATQVASSHIPPPPTTPTEAAADSAAGLLPAADVIEVKDGKPLTDVKAGKPVSAVIVDTKPVPKRVKAPARKPAKRAWTKIRPATKKKVKR